MTKSEYLSKALDLYTSDAISEEVYDAMVQNAEIFCDEDDDNYCGNLPRTYAEIEYADFENPEAIEGAKWDDMNYLHYMER